MNETRITKETMEEIMFATAASQLWFEKFQTEPDISSEAFRQYKMELKGKKIDISQAAKRFFDRVKPSVPAQPGMPPEGD